MHERINFEQSTLNIFTDASVKIMPYGFDSASAICSVIGDTIISGTSELNRNTTNNFGEMYAIYMGVNEALQFIIRNYPIKTINIFSDSRISVLGLKQWYKNWTLDSEGYLIGSSGRISNQHLICSIINMIITYKIKLSFYHIKGHTNINNASEIEKFRSKLKSINGDIGPSIIEDDVIKKLIYYNDYVDNYSRELVKDSKNHTFTEYILPINKFCNFDQLDLKLYSQLIDPRYQF